MNLTHYPRLDEKLYRTTLPNGLTVVVSPRPGFARKVAYFVTNYGSVHTKFTLDGEQIVTPEGVAHYLEHKMFDMPGGRDITEEFAALGANPNAFTSYDMTAYYFSCTENFSQALALLLEFVSTPYFTQESVDKEQDIIAQEILMYADSPDSRVYEDLMAGMYRHHPARHSIAGSIESIQAITPEILYQCHRAFYNPANMILCVAGDVDAEEVARIAENILPKEPVPAGIPAPFEPEEMTAPVPLFRREMEVSMPTFQLGFKCQPGRRGEEFARWELAAELAAEVLFGESSELYLALYEDGLIDSSFGGGMETIDGLAMLTCGGDSDDPEQVRRRIIAQAEKILQEGIDDAAFLRMKKSMMGRRVKDLDSFESCCFRLCAYHFEEFDYYRFPELFAKVQKQEVLDFLQENVKAERSALTIVLPEVAVE